MTTCKLFAIRVCVTSFCPRLDRQAFANASSMQTPVLIPVPKPVRDASLLPKRLKLERPGTGIPSHRRALPPLRVPADTAKEPSPQGSSRYVMRSSLPPDEHT